MSSNKRRNDNGQVRKEDYDVPAPGESAHAGSFQCADEATMKRRRMVSTRNPVASPPADRPPQQQQQRNVFSGMSLQASGSAVVTVTGPLTNTTSSSISRTVSLDAIIEPFNAYIVTVTAPMNSSWLELTTQYVVYHNHLSVDCTRESRAVAASVPAPGTDDQWIQVQSFTSVHMFRLVNEVDAKVDWTKFCSGKLILEQHRMDSTASRMLMRDGTSGRVQVNVSLRGLTFQRNDSYNEKTKQNVAHVIFRAINDPARGAKNFLMRLASIADADALEQQV